MKARRGQCRDTSDSDVSDISNVRQGHQQQQGQPHRTAGRCVQGETVPDSFQKLRLKRGEERRIRAGHLWVFSNEVDVKATPLTELAPGADTEVTDFKGNVLGYATVSPNSLICARLYSREARHLDEDFLALRLAKALALRERLFASASDQPFYRLVHAEGDMLPGLVVDRFGDHLTVQLTTLGMDMRTEALRAALHKIVQPRSILWDNTVSLRSLEGLALDRQEEGPCPDTLDVPENGCCFTVSMSEGQKTGWYYDQRPNRALMQRFARGKSVLDAFCYAGGFGVNAGRGGASSVVFADASKRALAMARHNLQLNAPDTACETLEGDAFETLKQLRDAGRRFDIVSIDPPAFIKRRKDHKEGLAAYRRLNLLAMSLVQEGGLFFTSSCSQLLQTEELRSCTSHAASRLGLHPRLLYTGFQGQDHPVHCAMPETAYLKCLVCTCEKF